MSEARVAVVIEDEPDLRELTEIMLVQAGFEVLTAADGPAGIQAVRDHDPALTTLDVNMPGMDGYEVARELRGFSQTYILMITGQADPADIQKAFEAGADDYVVKPFSIRDLRARAQAALDQPRRPDGMITACPPP